MAPGFPRRAPAARTAGVARFGGTVNTRFARPGLRRDALLWPHVAIRAGTSRLDPAGLGPAAGGGGGLWWRAGTGPDDPDHPGPNRAGWVAADHRGGGGE